jgi:hypothetical protein
MNRLVLALSTVAATAVVLTGVSLILGKAAPNTSKASGLMPAPTTPPHNAFAPAPSMTSSQPARREEAGIYRCKLNGQTVYSDKACPGGVPVDTSAASSTYRTPRFLPPAATPIDQPLVVAESSDTVMARECESIRTEIDRLDSMARTGGSASYMDWILSQRRKAEDRRYELRC